MGKPRRKFTSEFKQEAVDLLRRSEKTATRWRGSSASARRP